MLQIIPIPREILYIPFNMKPWIWLLVGVAFVFVGGYAFRKSSSSPPNQPPAVFSSPSSQEMANEPMANDLKGGARSVPERNMPSPRQDNQADRQGVSPGYENSQPNPNYPNGFENIQPLDQPESFYPRENSPPPPPPPPPDFVPEPFDGGNINPPQYFDGEGEIPPPFEPPPPLEEDDGAFIPPPVPFDNPEEADPIGFRVGF